jgi:hypothetical protein
LSATTWHRGSFRTGSPKISLNTNQDSAGAWLVDP